MSGAESFYHQVGGREVFVRLVDAFYEGVRDDPVLAPMYPEDDMEGAKWRLCSFLEQYWGGPHDYQEARGHPRLRMRHAGFRVNPDARERWLGHMHSALDQIELSPLHREIMWDYLERAAHSMVNTFDAS